MCRNVLFWLSLLLDIFLSFIAPFKAFVLKVIEKVIQRNDFNYFDEIIKIVTLLIRFYG